MKMHVIIAKAFLALWLATLCLMVPAKAAESYITAPGEAARAIGRIVEELGKTPEIHTIRITEKEASLLLRGSGARDVDEWRVRQSTRLLFLTGEFVNGPTAKQPPGVVADVASGFFPLDSVALANVADVAKRAIAYAKLEGGGSVQSIEIAKRVTLLPKPAYGDVQWTIYVASPRESASVYTDANGEIIGGDLSNTKRVQNMNFMKEEGWPKEKAIADLTRVIGNKPIIRDLTVYPKYVQVKADHPTIPAATTSYSWDLSGVTRSAITSPMFPGTEKTPALSLADVDLSTLGKVRENAIKAWGTEKATLNYMMLRLFSDGPGTPEPRWTVHFNDLGEPGEMTLFTSSGTVELTQDGTVRVANLPDARRPKRNWLDATAIEQTLSMIGDEFGTNARFAEISVSSDSMRVLAELPKTPGTMGEFNVNDRGISAAGMLMPWDAEFRPERLYRMNDLSFFSAQKLNELTANTFSRLKVGSEMAVTRYTFSIGQIMSPDGSFMVPSPDGKVTLEIRLDTPDGWKGGRVTYSSTGKEIDVVTP